MTREQIDTLRQSIEHLPYVVQRNWQRLPEAIGTEGHEDLDLFTWDKYRAELELLTKEYPLVDVRSPMDNYYPKRLAEMLLVDSEIYNGWRIPNPVAHYLALTYHNKVHKNDDPYKDELEMLFFGMFPRVKCTDPGVGYY